MSIAVLSSVAYIALLGVSIGIFEILNQKNIYILQDE